MARATDEHGNMAVLEKCFIEIPSYPSPYDKIQLRALPEISDSKAANYTNEPIIGRSNPLITYGYSEPRSINTELLFVVTDHADIQENIRNLRIIESLVYPGVRIKQVPYEPPPIVHIKCGCLLGDTGVCAILKNYSVKFPTDVAWDEETYLPYRLTVSCNWEVVYACTDLPTNDLIRRNGGTYHGSPGCLP